MIEISLEHDGEVFNFCSVLNENITDDNRSESFLRLINLIPIIAEEDGLVVGPLISSRNGLCWECFVGRLHSNNFLATEQKTVDFNITKEAAFAYLDLINQDRCNLLSRYRLNRAGVERISAVVPLPICLSSCCERLNPIRLRWEDSVHPSHGLVHSIHQIDNLNDNVAPFMSIGCRTDAFMHSRANNIGISFHNDPEIAKKITTFESLERYSSHIASKIYDDAYSKRIKYISKIDAIPLDTTKGDGSPKLLMRPDVENFEGKSNLFEDGLGGCAAGQSEEFALLKAFEEMIEREVITQSWLAGKSVSIYGRSWSVKRKDIEYNFALIGQQLDRFVVVCYLFQEWPKTAFGFGVAETIELASDKAERELVMTEKLLRKFQNSGQLLIPDRMKYFANSVDAECSFKSWISKILENGNSPLNGHGELSDSFWIVDKTTPDVAFFGVHVTGVIGNKQKLILSDKTKHSATLSPRA